MSSPESADRESSRDNRADAPEREKRYEPINRTESHGRAQTRLSRQESGKSSRSSRSLERACSITDGYSHHAVDNDRLQEPGEQEAPPPPPTVGEEFVVQWDGPGDPGNPRTMSKGRKWMIVLVMSVGSACVYVGYYDSCMALGLADIRWIGRARLPCTLCRMRS